MSPRDRELLFKRGRIALLHGSFADAARIFRALVGECDTDGRYLSYHGLLLGLVERRVADGVAACTRAITLASSEPEMYLNLARLYSTTGQRGDAVKTLRTAVCRGVRTRAVLGELQRLSPRRTPPLPALDRDHTLNRVLGKLRGWAWRGAAAGALARA